MNGCQESLMSEDVPGAKAIISTHRKEYMKNFLKEWHKKNPEKSKQYYENNKNKRDNVAETKRKREWAKAHPEYFRKYAREYYQLNKEKVKGYGRKYRAKHLEAIKVRNRAALAEYRKTEKGREYRKALNKKIYGTIKGKLNARMACGMNHCLRQGMKAKRKWSALAGYDVDQLKKHLESQFKDGMTWENYGSYWWIDHIIPISVFNFEKPEDDDFKRCWALSNLQPLEKIANIIKKNKLTKHFQPRMIFN